MFSLTLLSDNIQFPSNGIVEEEIVVSEGFVIRQVFDSTVMPIENKADIVQRGQLDRLAIPAPMAQSTNHQAQVVSVSPLGYQHEGYFTITHYCSCAICCGKTDGITATGTHVTAGRTIAVDPNLIPFGTKVWISGHAYTAEDSGGFSGNHIDIYVQSHQEAIQKGRFTTLVKY